MVFFFLCFLLLKSTSTGSKNIFIMDTSSNENIHLFCKSSTQPVGQPSFKTEYSSSKEDQRCCGELKVTNNFVCKQKTTSSEWKSHKELGGRGKKKQLGGGYVVDSPSRCVLCNFTIHISVQLHISHM